VLQSRIWRGFTRWTEPPIALSLALSVCRRKFSRLGAAAFLVGNLMSKDRTQAVKVLLRPDEILPLIRLEPEYLPHDPDELYDLAQVQIAASQRIRAEIAGLMPHIAEHPDFPERIARAKQRERWLRSALDLLRPEDRAGDYLDPELLAKARNLMLAGMGIISSPE
jgi:hypothetical protein